MNNKQLNFNDKKKSEKDLVKKRKAIFIKMGIVLFTFFLGIFLSARDHESYKHFDEYDDYEHFDDYDDYDEMKEKRIKKAKWERKKRGKEKMVMLRLKQMDTDKDKMLSKEEVEMWHEKIFKAVDKDKNDKISQSEFVDEALRKADLMSQIHYGILSEDEKKEISERAVDIFGDKDDNNDDRLERNEFFYFDVDKMFQRMDRNQDGKISQREMRSKWGHKRRGKRSSH